MYKSEPLAVCETTGPTADVAVHTPAGQEGSACSGPAWAPAETQNHRNQHPNFQLFQIQGK